MRGRRDPQATMPAFVDLAERVPKDHLIRTIKAAADRALELLSPRFERMCSKVGRSSVAPERPLKASLLISLYSVRSERAFREELEYNLLVRWFLDMNLMERSFDPTVFTKNRRRLLEHSVGQALFDEVVCVASRPAGTALGRALQCGWDADGGSSEHQELQTSRRGTSVSQRRSRQPGVGPHEVRGSRKTEEPGGVADAPGCQVSELPVLQGPALHVQLQTAILTAVLGKRVGVTSISKNAGLGRAVVVRGVPQQLLRTRTSRLVVHHHPRPRPLQPGSRRRPVDLERHVRQP